jgi:UDP-N-acetylglucosamine 1-carboxyvinyltransferase
MEMLVIQGNQRLSGAVSISGSKNSSLPILVSTLLSPRKSVINNVPKLADTRFLLELISSFGSDVKIEENKVYISSENIIVSKAHYDVVRKMRASILVLAPLLVRCGQATVSLPGGCAIGTRPVDIHLDGLRALGAIIEVKDGYIHASLKDGMFSGAEFELPLPSVGATENLIMAAVLARGTTTLKKVAREPEVSELCHALNNAGAKINGIGNSVLEIEGVSSLNSIDHYIGPDRIEASTFIAIAAATRSKFTIKNVCIEDLMNVVERFSAAGLNFSLGQPDDVGLVEIEICAKDRLKATDIETAAYPGFPTDMQAQFMAAMATALGTSSIYERIFENRMMHVPELRRMGADIDLKNGIALVRGKKMLNGAPVMATDLRASASLIVAALGAIGKSEIRRLYHLDRGYESLEQKLLGLGAVIERCHQ